MPTTDSEATLAYTPSQHAGEHADIPGRIAEVINHLQFQSQHNAPISPWVLDELRAISQEVSGIQAPVDPGDGSQTPEMAAAGPQDVFTEAPTPEPEHAEHSRRGRHR